jgi:hypothetical protein
LLEYEKDPDLIIRSHSDKNKEENDIKRNESNEINENYPDHDKEILSYKYFSTVYSRVKLELLFKLMINNCLFWACYYDLDEVLICAILNNNGIPYVKIYLLRLTFLQWT